MTPPPVNLPLSAIEEARAVLRRHLPASPCLEVHDGADRVGRLLVKAENLMPTGSFKIRGRPFGYRCCPPRSGDAASSPIPPETMQARQKRVTPHRTKQITLPR
jgi:hypothetical protein